MATHLELTWKKMDTKASILDKKLKKGDSVLIKDHTADVRYPRYMDVYRIVSFPGKTQVVDSKRKMKSGLYFGCIIHSACR